jgi:hypothetical protein
VTEPAPLSYGQLSVWRDVRDLEPARRHEANTRSIWALREQPGADDPPHTVAEVERALLAVGWRHESLRTVYDLSDPYAPTQRVHPSCAVEGGVFDCDPDDSAAFDAFTDRLAARPFDLADEPGWRYRIVTQGGRPCAAIVIKHHIAADGWSDDALRREFQSLLRSGAEPGRLPTPPTPRELAAWQRDGGGSARAAALRAHWENVFDVSAASLRTGEDAASADEGFQCTARSRAAYAGAELLARRLSVPLSSVVLAAFAWSAARRAGAGAPVVQLMSSNRFVPPWNTVISSMNQWTAAMLDAPDGEFEPFVRHVHARSLSAYRHGMYDVDENDLLRDKVRAGREAYEATCAYNYIGGATAPAAGRGADAEPVSEPEFVWEAPFSRIGHPCYLRAAGIGGHTLELRLRTLGLAKPLTGELLADVLSRLTDAVPRGV